MSVMLLSEADACSVFKVKIGLVLLGVSLRLSVD